MNIETTERLAKVLTSLSADCIAMQRTQKELNGYADTTTINEAIKSVASAIITEVNKV